MDPIMAIAIFVILWWLAFFTLLPVGVKNPHEAGETPPPGADHGAPVKGLLWIKAIWAAGIAILGVVLVYFAIQADIFGVRS